MAVRDKKAGQIRPWRIFLKIFEAKSKKLKFFTPFAHVICVLCSQVIGKLFHYTRKKLARVLLMCFKYVIIFPLADHFLFELFSLVFQINSDAQTIRNRSRGDKLMDGELFNYSSHAIRNRTRGDKLMEINGPYSGRNYDFLFGGASGK